MNGTAGLHIRPSRDDDLPALQRVRRAAFAPVFDSFRRLIGEKIGSVALARADPAQAELLEDFFRAGGDRTVLVAEEDKRIVGFACVALDRVTRVGEIGLNAVDPACSGRGIGTRLYEAALAKMRDAGMRVAEVGTGGDESHAPARRAYEKAGFGPFIPSITLYRSL